MKKAIFLTVILALYFPISTFAGIAHWTGGIQYITTSTYKRGVSCEYDYQSKKFWRIFASTGECPATVKV